MARTFNGSSQSLEVTSAIVSGAPLTLACWVRPDNITAAGTCISVSRTASIGYFSLSLRGDKAGDPVEAIADDGVVTGAAATTTGYSAGAWQHVCAVFTSSTARAVYLNGASKGTNTTSATPASLASTMIGGVWYTATKLQNLAGRIADAAAWNVALSDAEVEAMALGLRTADQIRPSALLAHWPLGGLRPDNDRDQWAKAYDLTATGSPGSADHPRLWYSSAPQIMQASAAAATSFRYRDLTLTGAG